MIISNAQPFIDHGEAPAPPFRIGTHLSPPLILKSGNVYGTVCCFSHHVDERIGLKNLQQLQVMARILAENLDRMGAGDLQLEPQQRPPK